VQARVGPENRCQEGSGGGRGIRTLGCDTVFLRSRADKPPLTLPQDSGGFRTLLASATRRPPVTDLLQGLNVARHEAASTRLGAARCSTVRPNSDELLRRDCAKQAHKVGQQGNERATACYHFATQLVVTRHGYRLEIPKGLKRANRKRASVRDREHRVTHSPARALVERETDLGPGPVFENMIPLGTRCSILELTEATCHWPIGDPASPNFFFCGGQTVDGLPYCAYQVRMAYHSVHDRRRDHRGLRLVWVA
jgi:hypothetical protein